MTTSRPTLSRRAVLGIGVGTAAGAAAVGFGIADLHPSAPAATPSAGGWPSPLLTARGLAAHLLRRAGFAPSEADLDAAARLPYVELVDLIVNQEPAALAMPADVINHAQFTAAWYGHMATTRAQFPERMTLFWHGVLTSDYHDSNRLPLVYQQNVLYRTQGRSDLRTLLLAATYDPLMMRFLNLDVSTAAAPNENYSRELMELFTLGPGNYTETDVREGARALSGIRMVLVDAHGHRIPPPKLDRNNVPAYTAAINNLMRSGARFRGVLNSKVHDSGVKTFLGRTGNLGPEEVVDTILAQPACASFVARRALTHFATPSPTDADVSTVATQFRNSRYDIRTLMRAVFTSPAFTNPANYRSLVRSPTDFMVSALRATGRTQAVRTCVAAATAMDQVLYSPPNVSGWPSNAGWVSSGTLLARLNFANALTTGGASLPDPAGAITTHLDNVVGADTQAAYRGASDPASRWYSLLAGAEFQLK